MKKLLLLLVLSVMCSSVVRADDFADGLKAAQKGNYTTALKLGTYAVNTPQPIRMNYG